MAKRIVFAALTLLAVSAAVFFIMYAIPGGPFNSAKVSAAVRAVLEKRYGLDRPVFEQYLSYMGGLLRGDWGVSLRTGRSVAETMFSSFAVSARIGAAAALLSGAAGVLLGCLAAAKHGRAADRIISFLSALGAAIPNFILATLLLLVFCYVLKLVPVWSADSRSFVLPVAALAVYPACYITRLTRSSLLDTLSEDYMRALSARGVSPARALFAHALRAALAPVAAYFAPMFAYVVTGSLVVESVFTIGGLGSKFVSSILDSDYTMIMGVTIFLSALLILANLASDMLCAALDRRAALK